eukprot:Ihof_evm1s1438 gene=Ihof_evmTU1s1438
MPMKPFHTNQLSNHTHTHTLSLSLTPPVIPLHTYMHLHTGFKPTSGNVTELNFRSSLHVWGYFSVGPSGGLHEFADSQFGHVFTWGKDRNHARRSMAVTLREISIRGDIRTTIEYLIKLLETKEFKGNNYNTAWLDGLIRMKMQSDKPDRMMSIVCAAAHICHLKATERHNAYTKALEHGQILDREYLSSTMTQDLVYNFEKYTLQVSQTALQSYVVQMNGSCVDVDLMQLNDGGSLLVFDNTSHVVYMKEEVDRYRLTIDCKTMLFQKEDDPTLIRTTSPGKLLRYLVDDGNHVTADQPFAEIEVMKMIMPLLATQNGKIKHNLSVGAVLQAGDVVATLVLDDPTK